MAAGAVSPASCKLVDSQQAALKNFFPATRSSFVCKAGDVKAVVQSDFEDFHRHRHLESFAQSMAEWNKFDPDIRNTMDDEILERFVIDIGESDTIRSKRDLEKRIIELRKIHCITPAKSQISAVYKYLVDEGKLPMNEKLSHLLRKKAVRSNSGVLVITVLTSPGQFSCPKDCHYCPNEPGQPRSYLSTEPAVLRANQNDWDPVRQFNDRATSLQKNGHVVDKIEILVLGGTWSGYVTSCFVLYLTLIQKYPRSYQMDFVRDIFYAANIFGNAEPLRPKLTLEEEQTINELAKCRIIGLTLETRPDFINRTELKLLRQYGCTRVQIGIQHVDDEILKYINRGCTRLDCIKAIRLLKNAGFKVKYTYISVDELVEISTLVDIHIMPDLPSSSPEKDLEMFDYILRSPDFQVDQWKIYPCEITPFSKIEQWYKEGSFIPYTDKESENLTELLMEVKAAVHPWIRLNRVVRDIPNQSIIAGNNKTNLRQIILSNMQKRNLVCRCIRCREIKDQSLYNREPVLKIRQFKTTGGDEYFLSYETEDESTIFGFLRLRLPTDTFNPKECPFATLKGASLVRELHVYGVVVAHDEKKHKFDSRPQHTGMGSRLLLAAELLALQKGYSKMAIIAGVGTRDYYRKFAYILEETFMTKSLSHEALCRDFSTVIESFPAVLTLQICRLPGIASLARKGDTREMYTISSNSPQSAEKTQEQPKGGSSLEYSIAVHSILKGNAAEILTKDTVEEVETPCQHFSEPCLCDTAPISIIGKASPLAYLPEMASVHSRWLLSAIGSFFLIGGILVARRCLR
ncbi:elongator complex protein ELP3 [Cardiosporidium cionae]|uniref:tRNA carboxymethyluridine synthase n=1 Tax=Cardiosporidium cionae TaxID=476202 RepID=A0ABQ7JEN8_9APIC|nr:elongator complex protein ELP3 [Cardiosporidium cionae]|eukprot:KAF8822115.1 elongator complex protein ELP3 [Cardiosporidium cionae]